MNLKDVIYKLLKINKPTKVSTELIIDKRKVFVKSTRKFPLFSFYRIQVIVTVATLLFFITYREAFINIWIGTKNNIKVEIERIKWRKELNRREQLLKRIQESSKES